MKADVLIFSKDRPMQLHLLLESVDRHAAHLYQSMTVLYAASTPAYALAYLDCLRSFPRLGLVAWRDEGSSFRQDVLDWTDWVHDRGRPLSFLVDDDVFYRQAALPAGDVFAFRVGWNTTHCYPLDCEQVPPTRLCWQWRNAGHDFAYPLSLDGNTYRHAGLILPLLHFDFTNPTELEAGLAGQAVDHFAPATMSCAGRSSLVGLPLNRVSSSGGNRHGNSPDYAPDVLLDRYLNDRERIDLDALDFSHVVGAHQEIALAFRPA